MSGLGDMKQALFAGFKDSVASVDSQAADQTNRERELHRRDVATLDRIMGTTRVERLLGGAALVAIGSMENFRTEVVDVGVRVHVRAGGGDGGLRVIKNDTEDQLPPSGMSHTGRTMRAMLIMWEA